MGLGIDTPITMSGVRDYTNSVKTIQSQLGNLRSAMRATTEEFKNNSDSTEALEKKQVILSEQIRLQGELLEKASAYLGAYKDKYGETSQYAVKMTDSVNNATAAYHKMQNQLAAVNAQLEKSKEAEQAAALNNTESALTSLERTLDLYESQLDTLEAKQGKGILTITQAAEKQELLKKAYESSKAAVSQIESQIDSFSGATGKNVEKLEVLRVKLNEAKSQMYEFENSIQKSYERLGELGARLQSAGADITKYLTAPILGLGTAAAKFGADFESAFAGVTQVVDDTAEGYERLKQGILDMDIPVAPEAVAGIVEIGGRLGVANDSLLEFSRTIIDTAETTKMSMDQAATDMARFANIIKMPQSEFQRLGSVILELDKNAATSGAEILDMGQKLAAAGDLANMSASDIMAIAAALSSLGLEAQAGGTAASKVIRQMSSAVISGGEDLREFARIAGVSASAFKDMFEKDAAEAMAVFIQGLGKVKNAGGDLTAVLSGLNISESRMIDTLSRLASSGDMLNNMLTISNKAWSENTALTEAAEKRYATTQKQIEALWADIKALGIEFSEAILPVVKEVIAAVREMIQGFSGLDDSTKEMIVKTGLLAATLGPVISALGSAVTGIATLQGAFTVLRTGAPATTQAIAQLANTMTFASGTATALGTALTTTALGPLALAAVGIAVGTAAWSGYKKAQEEARQEALSIGETLSQTAASIDECNARIYDSESLIIRWKELRDITIQNAGSTAELQNAREELAEVEQRLVDISAGIITNYDIESGNIEAQLPILRDKLQVERDLYEIKLKQQLQGVDIDALTQETEILKARQEELKQSYNEQEHALAQLLIQKDRYLSLLQNESIGEEEKARLIGEISAKTLELAKILEIDYNPELMVMLDSEAIAQESMGRTVNELERVSGEYQSASSSVKTYHDAQANLDKTINPEKPLKLAEAVNSVNYELIGAIDNLDDVTAAMMEEQKAASDLEVAYNTLSQGQSLSNDQMLNLINTYPVLAEYISLHNDLTFQNGEILREVAAAGKEAAINTARNELDRTKVTIDETEKRIKAIQAEIDALLALSGVDTAEREAYVKNLGITRQQMEEDLAKTKEAANKAAAALAILQSTARTSSSVRASAAKSAAKEENEAYTQAIKNLEKRISSERLTTDEIIGEYRRILMEFAKTEEEKLSITEKISALQEAEVKRFGETAAEALRSYYNEQKDMALDSLDSLKTAEKEQYEIVRENSREKISLLTDEYIERVRLIDEVTALQLESCNQQIKAEIERIALIDESLAAELSARYEKIDALNDEIEAERKAMQEKREQDKILKLEEKISAAESFEERIALEAELDDYKRELALKRKEDSLKLQQDEVKELKKAADDQIKEVMDSIGTIQDLQEASVKSFTELLEQEKEKINGFYKEMSEKAPELAANMFVGGDTDFLFSLMEKYNKNWQEQGKDFMDYLAEAWQTGNHPGDNLTASITFNTNALEENYGIISDMLSGQTKEVSSLIGDMAESIKGTLGQLESVNYGLAVNSGKGFIRGLDDIEPAIIAKARAIADRISSTIAAALEIRSPSEKFRRYGRYLGRGLILGMDDSLVDLELAAQRMSGKLGINAAEVRGLNSGKNEISNISNSHYNDSGGNVYLTIENFHNDSKSSTQELMEETAFIWQQKRKGRGW